MEKMIKEYIKNEFYLAKPKKTNTIFIDDLVFGLVKQVFSINDEHLDRLVEEVKQEIEFDVHILKRDNISHEYTTIRDTPDNYYMLLDFLGCVTQMKVRSFANEAWYEYLRYLERVVTDEIVNQLKTP